MGLFDRWRLNRAAKAYARMLGPALARTYGASQHYTRAQIEAGIRRLGLNLTYSCLAYAVFLPESEYERLVTTLPISMTFEDARAVYDRFRPHGLSSASGNPDFSDPSGGTMP